MYRTPLSLRAHLAPLACVAMLFMATTQAADVTIRASRLKGTTRPTIVLKLAPSKADTPAGKEVAFVTTFDTGSDTLTLRPATIAKFWDDPTVVVGKEVRVNAGPTSNLKAAEAAEDTSAKFSELHLNADKTHLLKGAFGDTKLDQYDTFDAFGCDYLSNGVIAIYDPVAAPVKTVKKSGKKIGDTGELVLLPALTKDNKTNPAIKATFDPSLIVPLTMEAFGGMGARPVVSGTFTKKGGGAHASKALWDTGCTTSHIHKDLVTALGFDLIADVKNSRIILPEVRFGAGGNAVIIKNLQAVVGTKAHQDVPFIVGQNVLDQFKMLIDLHNDPTIVGADTRFGLERTTVFQGTVRNGKVRDTATIGPGGTRVTVHWLDGAGEQLLDKHSNPITASALLVGTAGQKKTAEFKVPGGAVAFVQTVVLLPAPSPMPATGLAIGPTNSLLVVASSPRPDGPSGSKVKTLDGDDVDDPIIPAGYDFGNIWDGVFEIDDAPLFAVALPDLFLGSGAGDGFLPYDQTLYSAVDLTQFLDTIMDDPRYGSVREPDFDWIGMDFIIQDGVAYFCDPLDPACSSMLALPGFVFGTEPIIVDLLAGSDDPVFINAVPATGFVQAQALAKHEVVPRPCPADVNLDGQVDQADLGILLSSFGTCPGDDGYDKLAGTITPGPCVDMSDLGEMLAVFGSDCPVENER